MKAKTFRFQELYSSKFVITPKILKQSKKIFHTDVDLYLLTIYAVFLGKVTGNMKDNKRRPPIYKQIFVQALPFMFRFLSTLLLIMQIN